MLDPESSQTVKRWLAADAAEHELEAEAEFASLLRSAPREAPPGDLEERIWRATRLVRLRRRIARSLSRVAAGAALFGVAGATLYWLSGVVAAVAARATVRLVTWIVETIVLVLTALSEGLDAWSIVARLGRGIGQIVATPPVTAGLILILLIGILALYGLERMLAREGENTQ